MSGNPGYDLFRDFEQQIQNSFLYNSVMDLFPKMKVKAGKHSVVLDFVQPLAFSEAEVELIKRSLESFRTAEGEYQLPMIQKTIELTQDRYDLMVSEGQINKYMERVGQEMAANADKVLIFNNGLTSQQKPFYGLNDLGTSTGTPSRPIPASGTTTLTKAGAWTTATYASSDRAQLEGTIHQYQEFAGQLTLFHPAVAEIQLVKDMPGTTVGQRIKETFEKSFKLVPMGNDTGGLCISTASAETSTNFRLIAANCNKFVFAAPRAPVVNIRDERKSNLPRIWIDYEVYGALIPIPIVTPSGSWVKAMSDMDACGS